MFLQAEPPRDSPRAPGLSLAAIACPTCFIERMLHKVVCTGTSMTY